VIALSDRFVCVADEVWRLQRGSEADCVFFQRTVNNGERITDRGTRQGVWVIAPGGVLLAHANTRNTDKIVQVLEQGLAAWAQLPDESRHLAAGVDVSPDHRWEHSWPEGGLVLERIARDLPPTGLDGERSSRWNLDHMWVSRGELATLLPPEMSLGDQFELPLLARRMARFHLVDNAAGQSLPYADDELTEASLRATVTALHDGLATLSLAGTTRADADGKWRLAPGTWTPAQERPHGIETRLAGDALWNTHTSRFDDFELVAVGTRWGRTDNNGRGRDSSPGAIGFLLRTAPDTPRIAPTFVSLYDVDWITQPAVQVWVDSPQECGLDDS